MKKTLYAALLAVTTGATAVSFQAQSHYDDKQFPQSYRQSYFALLAANFGPIAASVKGEIPWDQARIEGWANDFSAVSELNVMRGFVAGSEKGTTRAKPGIWENTEDFSSKLSDMREAAAQLKQVAAGGDKEAIAAQVGAAGKTCKACHDEYKAENYLY
jgi:cytochrome c556